MYATMNEIDRRNLGMSQLTQAESYRPGVIKHSSFRSLRMRGIMRISLLVLLAFPAFAQTKLKLTTLKPGTERVQLINNGDFQFQGPLVGTNYPFPSGWSSSVDMYANAGSNMVAMNSGVVARAQVNSSAGATGFS